MCDSKMNLKILSAGSNEKVAANLLNHNINLITVLHIEVFGGLGLVESFTVEEEANVVDVQLNEILVTLCLWQ